MKVSQVKVQEGTSKVFLCKKNGEFRLSVLQKVGPHVREVIFIKNTDEKKFTSDVKKGLDEKKINPFEKIQRSCRFSKKEKSVNNNTLENQRVSEELAKKINRILSFHSIKKVEYA